VLVACWYARELTVACSRGAEAMQVATNQMTQNLDAQSSHRAVCC
jgi:hypothetical protein